METEITIYFYINVSCCSRSTLLTSTLSGFGEQLVANEMKQQRNNMKFLLLEKTERKKVN